MHAVQSEPGDALEDPVAGDELKIEHQRSRRHPSVGLVNLLHQRMTGPTGLMPQGCAACDQGVVRLDDVKVAQGAFHLTQAKFAPARTQRPESKLGHRHERDDAGTLPDESPGPFRTRQWPGVE